MIIPAIFAHTKEEFITKLRAIENSAPLVQIDIEDGIFVSTTSWADPKHIATLQSPAHFELHFMVANPIEQLKKWSALKNVIRATAHIETLDNPREFIEACRALGWKSGLALNPETSATTVIPYLPLLDTLLVLGVHPGPSGQTILPETFAKIKELSAIPNHPPIEIDGGVTVANLKDLHKAGASLFCAGGAIFMAPNPLQALNNLQETLHTQ